MTEGQRERSVDDGLVLAGVSSAISDVLIIDGVNLAVRTGEFCGLVGRNGAGKTTLLRTIMGQVRLRSGNVTFRGRDIGNMKRWSRCGLGIGYMPEHRGLVPDLTVRENVLVPAWANRLSNAKERLALVYEYVPELREVENRRATQLSGGQQKLVALGRALLAGEKLILLDEPTEGVAPVLAARLIEVLANIRSLGISALIAESNEGSVEGAVDRLYEIERGVVTSVGAHKSNSDAEEPSRGA